MFIVLGPGSISRKRLNHLARMYVDAFREKKVAFVGRVVTRPGSNPTYDRELQRQHCKIYIAATSSLV
jgi:hypothetical protein